jgi:hypothetical protein
LGNGTIFERDFTGDEFFLVLERNSAVSYKIILIFFLASVLLSWPTITQIGSYVPGDGGDDPAIVWNLWWVKYALLNAGQNPFNSDFMFFPIGINLVFYTLTVLNAVTALPLTLLLSLPAASNLHLLFTFTVGGYGTYLLVWYILGKTPGKGTSYVRLTALVAGAFYVFASNKWFYVALGQFNIASTHWIPFAVLYILRAHDQPTRLKNAVMAGFFMALQAWAEMTYASFLLVFLGLYWLFVIIHYWPRLLSQLRAGLLTTLIFVIGISPLVAQMLPDMLAEGDFLVEGSGFAEAFSADLLGLIIPTMLHPLLGYIVYETNITNFDKGQHIYLGVVFLGLAGAALGSWRQPRLKFWFGAAVVFGLLALGPVITANGHSTGIPGPFLVFQQLPVFKANRYPSRYGVMLVLSLSIIAAFGLAWLGQRISSAKLKNSLLGVVAALFLFEHLGVPLPQSDMRIPAQYQVIARDPANTTVLDIPFAWRNGFRIIGAVTTEFMFGQFYQTFHQKPLLQGNTSRNPSLKFDYFTRAPVLNSLLALEIGKSLPPQIQANDRELGAAVLDFFNIGYIVVRPDSSGNPAVTPQATIPYIETSLPVEKIIEDEMITVFRVKPKHKVDSVRVLPADPLAPLYFGEGWGLVESGEHPFVAQRETVRLMLPLMPSDQRLTLRITRPETLASESQTLTISLNNWTSEPRRLTPDQNEYSVLLPAHAIQSGLNDVFLHFDQAKALPLAPVIDISVTSAGEDVGGFGHIYVNGHDVSPNQRGYNVAIIDPGARISTASFDTHLDPAASTALAEFLRSASPDATIAVAAADEASGTLTEEAVQTLQQVTGSTSDLRGCFRCSHAIIRHKGRTIETLDPLRPVAIATSLGLTEPSIAAQIDWIDVEAVAD